MSSNPAKHHGKHSLHQHPLLYIAVFLVFALGALLVIVVGNQPDGDDVAAGDTAAPAQPMDCPRGEPTGFELSDVEGKSLDEVEDWADENDMTVRVVMEDGQPNAMTMDYRTDRVNVQVEDGTVTRYCGNH